MTNASEFKARCLAILDNFRDIGKRVAILERGRPVADFSRVTGDGEWNSQTELWATVVTFGDVFGSVLPEAHWDSPG